MAGQPLVPGWGGGGLGIPKDRNRAPTGVFQRTLGSAGGGALTVTEVPMKAGSWSMQLDIDTPLSIMVDMVNGSDAMDAQLVVFAGQVPETAMNLSDAVYNGVIGAVDPATNSVAGTGILSRWGTDDATLGTRVADPSLGEEVGGGGDLVSQFNAYKVSSWMSNGSIQTTGGSQSVRNYIRGFREKFEEVIKNWDTGGPIEYRMRPDGTVDVGNPSFLWPTTDVLLSDKFRPGRFGPNRAIDASAIRAVTSPADRSKRTIVAGDTAGGGTWGVSTSSNGVWANGGAAEPARLVDEPNISSNGVALETATRVQAFYDDPVKGHEIVSTDPLLRSYVEPGQPVRVWFPDQLIIGSNQYSFAAVPYWPIEGRVRRMSTVFSPEHWTVALYRSQGTESWTRLNPWVPRQPSRSTMELTTRSFTLQVARRTESGYKVPSDVFTRVSAV